MDSPLNIAHQHAQAAEDYIAQGLLVSALDSNQKAADAFQKCIDLSSDEKVRRTFTRLVNEHLKSVRELERKIALLREKGVDPNVPQRPAINTFHSGGNYAINSVPFDASNRAVPSPPPGRSQRMTDSAAASEESFMVLGGQKSDPGDAFHQFWRTTEGMLHHLSQPVAFATAPIHPEVHKNPSSKVEQDSDGSLSTRLRRNLGLGASTTAWTKGSGREPSTIAEDIEQEDEDSFDNSDDMAESFFMIEAVGPSSLKKENAKLKEELDKAHSQIRNMDKQAQVLKDRDLQLQESIYAARKHAQRAMGASLITPRPNPLDFLNATPAPPQPQSWSFTADKEAQLNRRVRELEEELRISKVEIEKQRLQINKFREKWASLKENARRKKELKAAEAAQNQIIQEEPEAEQNFAE